MTKYINDPENLIPDNKLVYMPLNTYSRVDHDIADIVEPLRGNKTRDWFPDFAYRCLPLTIANQYGFLLKSAYDITLFWDGDNDHEVVINVDTSSNPKHDDKDPTQIFLSNFKNGIISILNFCSIRTAPYINIMTWQPPNMINNPDLFAISGVIESDNLRPPFTFNLKILTPNKEIKIKRGDALSGFFPIPRYFVDQFEIASVYEYFDRETINSEQDEIDLFFWERRILDPATTKTGAGRKYFKGIHHNGDKFEDHQTNLLDSN